MTHEDPAFVEFIAKIYDYLDNLADTDLLHGTAGYRDNEEMDLLLLLEKATPKHAKCMGCGRYKRKYFERKIPGPYIHLCHECWKENPP